MFALACTVGVVLTLGLISRWGEVFPRWVPVLSGRAVPVMLAVVPGTLVAAVITISAPGMLLGPIESGEVREVAFMLFFFPFPVWGPLLGAAVFAYWLRRTRAPDPPAAAHADPGPTSPGATPPAVHDLPPIRKEQMTMPPISRRTAAAPAPRPAGAPDRGRTNGA